MQQKRKHADNTDLMVQINGIVNEYIHVEKPDREAAPSLQFDISKIDFDLLSRGLPTPGGRISCCAIWMNW